jgi:plasmid stabilization system protein ParE
VAEVIWAEPALQELDAIAEYIALDNPAAASDLVQQIFYKTERLENFPQSGRIPPELPNSVYREATSVKIVVALFMLQVSLLELILAPLACPDSGIRPRPCSSFG